jgi:peptidoglycan hydrolase CwlO-like protein
MRKICHGVITLLIALSFVMIGSAFAAGKGGNPNGKPFIVLNEQIIEVEGEMSSLQDQIDSLVGKVDSVEQKVVANQNAISSLEQQNLDLQAQINANATTIQDLQASIDALQADNVDLQAQIDLNGDMDGSLQNQIDTNNGLIVSLQQNLSSLTTSLQDQINNNGALIALLQEEINAINEMLDLKQNLVNGICPDGSAIKSIQDDGSVFCENVTANSTPSIVTGTAYSPYYICNPHSVNCIVYAKCPAGFTVVGGGYQNTRWWLYPWDFRAVAPDTWYGRFVSHNNHPVGFYGTAQCIKLQ